MNEWPNCPLFDSNLKDIAYSINVRRHDWVNMNFGIEGSGKSTFGLYGCKKVDPTFNIDRVVFTLTQLKMALKLIRPGQAIMIDEAGELMFSRDWNSKESKELVKYMMIMRHKSAFLWMNIPDFKYADIYVRAGRLRSLTRTITKQRRNLVDGKYRHWRQRGYFFGYTRKAVLNHLTKKYYMVPLFFERYPDMRKMGDDAKHLVELYDSKKDRFLEERNEVEEHGNRKRGLRAKGKPDGEIGTGMEAPAGFNTTIPYPNDDSA